MPQSGNLGIYSDDFEQRHKICDKFSDNCIYPQKESMKLSNVNEKLIVAYISGYGTEDGRIRFGNDAANKMSYEKLVDIKDDQELLLFVEARFGDLWVDMAHDHPNVSVVGARFSSGIQLNQDKDDVGFALGSFMQWALDKALYEEKKAAGSWIEYFEYYWRNKIHDFKHEEWEKDSKILKIKISSKWEKEFPNFYDKYMQTSPESIIPTDDGLIDFDILQHLQVSTWKELSLPWQVQNRTKEEKANVEGIIEYLQENLPYLGRTDAEIIACYLVFHRKKLTIPK